MNYVVLTIFASTTAYVAANYQSLSASALSHTGSPLNSSILPMALLWTMCLAYFFGFFGISFLDKESLEENAETATETPALPPTRSRAPTEEVKTAIPFAAAPVLNDTAICCELPAGTVSTPSADAVPADGPSDDEYFAQLVSGELKDYQLEKKLGDYERAVSLRRRLYAHTLQKPLTHIPYKGYDYNKVFGANCEIVIGYVPIPLGIVGPVMLNGENVYVPMATTEGCLVASTNRGCKAITVSGGCSSVLLKDAITRAPCLRLPSAMRAAAVKLWVDNPTNYAKLEAAFNSTTNYGRLESITTTIAGRNVYLRFCCMSGDAMGMNMVSKGCLKAIEVLELEFPDVVLVAISGNMCTDKKPSAVNWIMGRGKSIVVEAVIPEHVVKSVLKTTVHDIIETNKQKNHIGSAMAGSIGGFNAHASNIVTAVYLATGQDPAQNVESSNCLTIMELAEDGQSLHVSVTMPSVEVGTVGGGTHLPAQAGCLEICGVRGASRTLPGDNARKLAQIVGAAVLAGELSLMAALAANHLVRSHMQHNRKPAEAPPSQVQVQASILRKHASMPDLKESQH